MSDHTDNSTLANPSAEMALLSCCSRGGQAIVAEAAALIREEWFSDAKRAMCWRVMRDFLVRGVPIDLTLIEDGMREQGFPGANARQMVEALGSTMPSGSLWRPLAERVESYYLRREGVRICQESMAKFANPKAAPADTLEQVEAGFFALHSDRSGKGMRHIRVSMLEALDSIEESIRNRGHVTGGLACGFTGIDRCNIKGLRPGHVWIIAAPPGGGKTVMLMKLAWNIATGKGDYNEFDHPPAKVGIFSLEMDDVQLAERVLIRLAEIEMNKMDRGQMSRAEQQKIRDAVAAAKDANLWLEHCPGITIQELRVKARYAVARFGLQCIGIDYAQLIRSSSKAAQGNRTQEMQDVSQGLKLLAQECGVPVIVLAQPKQETWGLRAGLNALGETSQLSKDADLVGMLGVWDSAKLRLQDKGDKRPEKKKGAAPAEEADWMDDMEGGADLPDDDDPDGFAYFDIVKNRHGPNTVGKPPVKLLWEKDWFNFKSTNSHLFDSTGKRHD